MPASQAENEPARKSPAVSVAITLAGLAVLTAAAVVGLKSYRYSTNAVKTQATVIEIEMTHRRRVSYPRYQYVVDGVSYTAKGGFGTNPPSYTVGDTVEIEYVPDRPADSRISSWAERWVLTLFITIAGGVLTAVGGSLILASRRSSTVTTGQIDD